MQRLADRTGRLGAHRRVCIVEDRRNRVHQIRALQTAERQHRKAAQRRGAADEANLNQFEIAGIGGPAVRSQRDRGERRFPGAALSTRNELREDKKRDGKSDQPFHGGTVSYGHPALRRLARQNPARPTY